jgi:hypothetical protein
MRSIRPEALARSLRPGLSSALDRLIISDEGRSTHPASIQHFALTAEGKSVRGLGSRGDLDNRAPWFRAPCGDARTTGVESRC